MSESTLVRALDALEDGDSGFAADLLRSVTSAGPACLGKSDRIRCDGCGRRFRWPGELDDHICAAWRRTSLNVSGLEQAA